MEITPFFTACWAAAGGVLYGVILFCQGRQHQITSLDFGASCFQFLSLLNGGKQIIIVFTHYYTTTSKIFEMDQLYLAYGGLCVMWIAFAGLRKRLEVV